MKVITLEVSELGNRCHLVHDGASALVVDPPRDLTAVERAAESEGVEITAVAETTAQTGVEMEALTAASVAALTIYDMVKGVDSQLVIGDVRLLEKTKS